MRIFVGLGNPGNEYANTYHNVGFMTVDMLSAKLGIKLSKKGYKALYGEGKVNGEKVMLVKPQTYMNLSGECILMLKKKFKDAKFLVIADDVDLPLGQIRYRAHGSGGTHNGLKNIVSFIGGEFERIRVGIGRPEGDLAGFVLSKVGNDFESHILSAVEEAVKRL